MKRIIKFKYRILVLSIEILTFFFMSFIAYNFIIIPEGKKTFYLHSGDIKTLTSSLEKNGYSIFFIDKLLMQFIVLPQEGWYSIDNEKQGRFFFFNSLYTQRTPLSKLMNIKVFAGETKLELTKRLANDINLDHYKLLIHYNFLSRFDEADIFSGDYTLAKNADENVTIDYLVHSSNKKLIQFSKTYANKTPEFYEFKVLLVIASIIQKESNAIHEMPLISSVIYNRLKKNMRLQMDGTLNYGKYAHTIVTPERIKTDTSPYNTYKHKGLPPAPLSSVSFDALKAAYAPEITDYLFFMLTKDGTHTFTDTYAKHLENIRSFRRISKKSNTSEANVTEANVTEANVTEANVTEANVTEANVTEANVTK